MKFQIQENKLTEEVKKRIFKGFGNHALEAMGMDGSRSGYARNTTFHYLKKNLSHQSSEKKQITRIGVYGVAMNEGKILLIRQKRGPYAGKLDFPGGGIEFGESAEQALRRELLEEVAMKFDSLQLIDNLNATVEVPGTPTSQPYLFYHIGMIYRLNGCQPIDGQGEGDLPHAWIDLKSLSESQCSNLLWKYISSISYAS